MEEGSLAAGSMRDFVFANAVRFYSAMNPDFFVGTSVERSAAALLAE